MRRTRTMRWKGRATGRHPKTDVRSVFATPMTSPSNVADFCDRLRTIGVRLEVGVEGATEDLDYNLQKWIKEAYDMGTMAARYRTRRIRSRGDELQRLAETFAKVAIKFNRDFEACLAALEDDEARQRDKKARKAGKAKGVPLAKSAFTLD